MLMFAVVVFTGRRRSLHFLFKEMEDDHTGDFGIKHESTIHEFKRGDM